jgi:asparagine synthetase B (glutamine-hydrolysing)
LTVGRERYDRVAGAVGIEPRDPFLDLRVLSYCVGLPDGHVLAQGWPKAILRRATADLVPDEVRWRRGKEHLGWTFTAALIEQTQGVVLPSFEADLACLSPYVDVNAMQVNRSQVASGDAQSVSEAYHLWVLAQWLRRHERRPIVNHNGGEGS